MRRYLSAGFLAALVVVNSCVPVRAQDPSAIFNMFGGIMQNVIAEAARDEWRRVPTQDIICLQKTGVSVRDLILSGIRPDDPSVRAQVFECRRANQPVQIVGSTQIAAAAPARPYSVDGLALGARVQPESAAYHEYKCEPSEQFPEFTLCQRRREKSGTGGRFKSKTTILHDQAGVAAYVSETIEPAHFQQGEIEREIARISERFGTRAKVLRSRRAPNGEYGVIAYWGEVELHPLASDEVSKLASGEKVRLGYMFDFIGNFRESARAALPIYKIAGGPGYIWGATIEHGNSGRLRMTTVDASQYLGSDRKQDPTPKGQGGEANGSSDKPDSPTQRTDPERKDRAIAVANQILGDAIALTKSYPNNPHMLDFVDQIQMLKGAVEQGEVDLIEKKTAVLLASLRREPKYRDIERDRIAELKRQEAIQLGDQIKLGARQKRFILKYVSQNPASAAAGTLAPLVRQLDQQLQQPVLKELRSMTGNVEIAMRAADLMDAFRAEPDGLPPDAQPRNVPNANGDIPRTAKNSFLIDGDLDDVVLLYNASPNSPHVSKNLRGDIVFLEGQADACIFHKDADDALRLLVRDALQAYKPRAVDITRQSCDGDHLPSYDVIAVERGAFLRQDRVYALALTKEVELEGFKKLALITGSDRQAQSDRDKKRASEIESDVANGSAEGFGVVLLKNGSGNICAVFGSQRDGHRQMILSVADRLAIAMNAMPTIDVRSTEDAFRGAQKAQCGAIYASAADLKTTITALKRENIASSFANVWFSSAQVEAEEKRISAAKAEEERAAQIRRQKVIDAERLKAARNAVAAAKASSKQSELRKAYGASATAAAADLAKDVKEWTDNRSGRAGQMYPSFGTWLRDKLADHWEVMSFNHALADYGTSDWKGRALDTTFANVALKLRNRILGEYEDACFVFGNVNDAEFAMLREPFVARCDDIDAIATWKTGHSFASRWIVEGADGAAQ